LLVLSSEIRLLRLFHHDDIVDVESFCDGIDHSNVVTGFHEIHIICFVDHVIACCSTIISGDCVMGVISLSLTPKNFSPFT
jgi:hypothetical protein